MAKFIYVVLKFPRPIAKFLVFAKTVLSAMEGNPKFPNATTLVAALATAVQQLETAISSGNSADREAARGAVREALGHLANHVQLVAETAVGTADLASIRAMVVSAGMDLRTPSTPQKLVFAAYNGPVPGSVDLTAPRSRQRDPHEWEISTDQHTWTALQPTRKAKTRVTGLPAGVTHYFRHRTLTKDGYTEWSDPVMIVVK